MRLSARIIAVALAVAGSHWSHAGPYSWTDVTPADSSVATIAIHPLDGKRLVAVTGVFSQALQTSNDGGLTWRSTATPVTTNIHRLFAHPGRPGVLFLQQESFFFQPGVGDAIFTPGATFRSDDFGASWTRAYLPASQEYSISPFASDPLDVNHVFATRRTQAFIERMTFSVVPGQDSTVISTRDLGSTWTAPAAGLPQNLAFGTTGKAFSPFDNADGPNPAAPTRLFFTYGTFTTDPVTFFSVDSGVSWTQLGTPGSLKWVRQDPRNANVLYALRQPQAYGGQGQLLRSDDYGASWRSIFDVANQYQHAVAGFDPMIAIDPVRSRNLWLAGLDAGVFHSTDGGRSWIFEGFAADTILSGGMTYVDARTTVRAVHIDTGDPGVVYVLRNGKLYRGVPATLPDPVIVEYHYEADRYWLTSLDGEALSQDYRMEPGNVRRTGLKWGAWRADDAPAGAAGSCRFWPQPFIGRSRVIVQQGSDCEALRRDPGWTLEAENEFFTMPPVNDACPANTVPVRRFLNLQPDFNHRWVADASLFDEMRSARAWADEGVRFCARPLRSGE